MLIQEELLNLVFYENGHLFWHSNRLWVGRFTGNNYVGVRILDYDILEHHLVWLYFNGYTPEYLDHKDGCPYNNLIENLREATHSQNMANSKRQAVGYEIHGRKYRVRIGKGHRVTVGSFDTPKEAQEAYIEAHKRIYGEFSIFNRGEVCQIQ